MLVPILLRTGEAGGGEKGKPAAKDHRKPFSSLSLLGVASGDSPFSYFPCNMSLNKIVYFGKSTSGNIYFLNL